MIDQDNIEQPLCDHEDCDGHLCGECEKVLAWRPFGWWKEAIERKFPAVKVVRREQ